MPQMLIVHRSLPKTSTYHLFAVFKSTLEVFEHLQYFHSLTDTLEKLLKYVIPYFMVLIWSDLS